MQLKFAAAGREGVRVRTHAQPQKRPSTRPAPLGRRLAGKLSMRRTSSESVRVSTAAAESLRPPTHTHQHAQAGYPSPGPLCAGHGQVSAPFKFSRRLFTPFALFRLTHYPPPPAPSSAPSSPPAPSASAALAPWLLSFSFASALSSDPIPERS